MEEKEKEELEKKPEQQRGIIYSCMNAFDEIKYLQGSETKKETEREILDFSALQYVQKLLWNYLVLELWKLFSDNKKNEHYAIRFFVKTVIENYHAFEFNEFLAKEIYVNFNKEFSSKKFKQHHDKLKAIRNKHVAHLDIDRVEVNINNEDVIYFLHLANRFLTEIIDPIACKGGSGDYMKHPATLKNFIIEMATYKGVHDKIERAIWDNDCHKETEADLLRILGKRNFVEEGIG